MPVKLRHKESIAEQAAAKRQAQGSNVGSGRDPRDDGAGDAQSEAALQNLVSLALSCAGEGRSGLEFEREVTRYQLAGADMGASLRSRHFYGEAVYRADMILSTMEGMSWGTSHCQASAFQAILHLFWISWPLACRRCQKIMKLSRWPSS